MVFLICGVQCYFKFFLCRLCLSNLDLYRWSTTELAFHTGARAYLFKYGVLTVGNFFSHHIGGLPKSGL